MLKNEEIKRRMEAARKLRGLSQAQLGKLFEADDLGKMDPQQIERGIMPLRGARLAAACRHLRVPERWFTAEDVDEIVGFTPVDTPTLAKQVAAEVVAAMQAQREAR